jgi:SAM-dependent methyltransferase
MDDAGRRIHWDDVYAGKGANQLSWFEQRPAVSLDFIAATGATPRSAIIDVGGGASRLVDCLVAAGYQDVTVLDLSAAALAGAKARLGAAASKVTWMVADVTTWEPSRRYDVWHDRAAFHFLTAEADRAGYVQRLLRALAPGGQAIIGTFALDGPERCSGLPVVRYGADSLGAVLGPSFALAEAQRFDHQTPTGAVQRFQFSRFKRVDR